MFLIQFFMILFCHKSMHNHQHINTKVQIQDTVNLKQQEQFRIDILIVGRILEDKETFMVVEDIIRKVENQAKGVFYFLDDETTKEIHKKHQDSNIIKFEKEEHSKKLHFVITIGGDGTILYAAKQFSNNEEQTPPFLVFQKGTLGFMCQFSLDHLQTTIEKAIRTQKEHLSENNQLFKTIRMMRLGAELKNSNYETTLKKICVNQVAITRQNSQKIILEIYLNKQLLTVTQGDGLLIATPTGSTAYALSAGGPIIQNGVNCIEIVPIAPYSLSFRPLCLPSTCQITIEISEKSKSEALVSFDGQAKAKLMKGESLTIKKSSSDIIFYQPLDEMEQGLPEWVQRLQLFLHWNEGFKPAQCKYNLEGVKKITNRVQSYGMPTSITKRHSSFKNDKERTIKSDIDNF